MSVQATDDNTCQRCDTRLTVQNYSWFNGDTICLCCVEWEDKIINNHPKDKHELRAIGEVPDVDFEVEWGQPPPEDL